MQSNTKQLRTCFNARTVPNFPSEIHLFTAYNHHVLSQNALLNPEFSAGALAANALAMAPPNVDVPLGSDAVAGAAAAAAPHPPLPKAAGCPFAPN
jgi:hypothetical protein